MLLERGDINPNVLRQRRQATGKALGHTTECPGALATVEFAENQCRFLHALCRNRRFDAAAHGYIQLRERCKFGFVLVDRGSQRDFFNGRINGLQVEAEHRTPSGGFHQFDRAIVHALLAEKAHVVVATHLA